MRAKPVYIYTLTLPEYRNWTASPTSKQGKRWRVYIEQAIRFKARASRVSKARILAPDGQVLSQFRC